jgi:hypothetical protein
LLRHSCSSGSSSELARASLACNSVASKRLDHGQLGGYRLCFTAREC